MPIILLDDLLDELENPTWQDKFAVAFFKCLDDGVHPGPAEINDRLGRGRRNMLNGRESKLRLELMRVNRIPYARNGAFGKKGEVPGHSAKGYSQIDLNFRDY